MSASEFAKSVPVGGGLLMSQILSPIWGQSKKISIGPGIRFRTALLFFRDSAAVRAPDCGIDRSGANFLAAMQKKRIYCAGVIRRIFPSPESVLA
jgi:hypothetical protein